MTDLVWRWVGWQTTQRFSRAAFPERRPRSVGYMSSRGGSDKSVPMELPAGIGEECRWRGHQG